MHGCIVCKQLFVTEEDFKAHFVEHTMNIKVEESHVDRSLAPDSEDVRDLSSALGNVKEETFDFPDETTIQETNYMKNIDTSSTEPSALSFLVCSVCHFVGKSESELQFHKLQHDELRDSENGSDVDKKCDLNLKLEIDEAPEFLQAQVEDVDVKPLQADFTQHLSAVQNKVHFTAILLSS